MAKQRRRRTGKKQSYAASRRRAGRPEVAHGDGDGGDGSLTLKSFMAGTNGGGSPENVPGFDLFRAVTAGFETRRIAGPTFLAAHPDGGFFSQGGSTMVAAVRSPAAKPENVIGVDNRVVVSNTSMTPWRCICHLEVEYERGPVGFGTGFLISEHAVVTAAHVLMDRSSDGWNRPRKARRVRVVPGRNGTLAPYGYFVSEEFKVPDGWGAPNANQNAASAFDYGAVLVPKKLKVSEESFGKRLGYFGLKAFTDNEAARKNLLFVNNAGYPHEGDKPYGTLWYNAGRVDKIGDTFVEYLVDTEGGHSGSPVYFFDEKNNERYVIAIHTTGDFVNRGLRITPAVFKQICQWAERLP
jgi:glutamyl endopeptidase